MTIAISQPTYLPWLGYFDLIDQSDTFVVLDSVQFEKQSWQQRNRIKTPPGLLWLTVPVVFRGRLEQRIHEVEIRDPGFWQKHVRAIELSYRRAPYFNRYFPQVAEILQSCGPGCLLADLNLRLIRWFCGILGIQTPLLRSSSMNEEGRRSEFLVNVCRSLRADVYLSLLAPPVTCLRTFSDFRMPESRSSSSTMSIQNTASFFRHSALTRRCWI